VALHEALVPMLPTTDNISCPLPLQDELEASPVPSGSRGARVRKKSSISDAFTYLDYEWLPGVMMSSTRSATKMVKQYASGVRVVVESTK
jgi:hypothetical protein